MINIHYYIKSKLIIWTKKSKQIITEINLTLKHIPNLKIDNENKENIMHTITEKKEKLCLYSRCIYVGT